MKTSFPVWLAATLLGVATSTPAQDSKGGGVAPADAEMKKAGPRLRVEFVETRSHGDQVLSTRPYTLVLHADESAAKLFVGTQVPLAASDNGQTTLNFKNAGVLMEVEAQTLPDGRYRLDARFEEGSPLGSGGDATMSSIRDNPILHSFRSTSKIALREGETVPFATVVDPVTGDLVRVDVRLSAARDSGLAAAPNGDPRVRVDLLLTRRKGATKTASRPYSVSLQPGEKTGAALFSGSQLPLQVTSDGRPTIALKDVGASAELGVQRQADGRYRLDVHFSDGSLGTLAIGATPSLKMFQGNSVLLVRAGEAVTFASAIDPLTGETVEVEAKVDGVR